MLKDNVDSYLKIRHAAGFKLRDDERHLHSFARYAAACGDTHVVAKTAITWAGQASSEAQRANRLKAVIRFARFSRAEDPHHEVPPQGVFCGHRQRPTPCLFSDEQVRALMNRAAQLGPAGCLRPHTYNTLIGLLAATGLRISEALGLRFEDITSDGLLIRATKFRKKRLVPIHRTTHTALEHYLARRQQIAVSDDHVFISQRRRPLAYTTVYRTFQQLLKDAGVPVDSGLGRRPRLIDFRHTFASKALVSCSEDRDHIGRHMLALMTYLGHAHPRSTFWYLESSPELMGDIVQACQQFIVEGAS
jgi:integrase/recombinase XerD